MICKLVSIIISYIVIAKLLGTSCPGYELSWVRVVLGTSCLGYELSCVRVVLGTSCPGYELSWVRVVHNPFLCWVISLKSQHGSNHMSGKTHPFLNLNGYTDDICENERLHAGIKLKSCYSKGSIVVTRVFNLFVYFITAWLVVRSCQIAPMPLMCSIKIWSIGTKRCHNEPRKAPIICILLGENCTWAAIYIAIKHFSEKLCSNETLSLHNGLKR